MIVVIVCLSIDSCHRITGNRGDEGLTEVPADIPTNVSQLYLNDNNITALRDCEFCPYTQLLELYLSKNLISVISSTAFQHTTLGLLYLDGNQLVVVPDLHFIAETLKRFDLADNQITSISSTAFDECTALTGPELERQSANSSV